MATLGRASYYSARFLLVRLQKPPNLHCEFIRHYLAAWKLEWCIGPLHFWNPVMSNTHAHFLVLCKFTSPSRENFPNANSVYRVHGGAPQDNSTDLYSKHWFVFDASLVLPEYIIYYNYLSPVSHSGALLSIIHIFIWYVQRFPDNALDVYISSHSLPEDEDIDLVPSASACPRLAMLDEPTLLELTGDPSISSVQVCRGAGLGNQSSLIWVCGIGSVPMAWLSWVGRRWVGTYYQSWRSWWLICMGHDLLFSH